MYTKVPLPYRPTSWSDWQMNLLAHSGVLVAIQSISSMKNHWTSLAQRFWMVYLTHLCSQHSWIREKAVMRSKKKGASEGEERQAWDSLVCASKSRDIIRVAICCLFLMHVWVSRAVATAGSTESCMTCGVVQLQGCPSFQERCAECITLKTHFIIRA